MVSISNLITGFLAAALLIHSTMTMAGDRVVVVPMPGDTVMVPAIGSVVRDTPSIGNYQRLELSVIDLTSGLEWQKRRTSSTQSWQNAVDYCALLSIDDRGTIWRLPEIDELITLFRFGQQPYIEERVFLSSRVSFWSSTVAADDVVAGSNKPNSRWVIHFSDNSVRDIPIEPWSISPTAGNHYVRCVTN